LPQVTEQPVQTDTVVGDIRVCIGLFGHHEGQATAEAVAHRRDLAVRAGLRARSGDGRFQVLDALDLVEGLEQFEGPIPLGVGFVGDVDTGLDAPEQVGTNGDEAEVGDPGGDVAYRLVYTEDFLDDDDDAGGFGFGFDDVGCESAAAVGGSDGDAGHFSVPPVMMAADDTGGRSGAGGGRGLGLRRGGQAPELNG
jgi:hypothetical protein